MITYDLILEKQKLVGADRFSIAANANETVNLRFHFDRNWRRFDSKAAVFRNADGEYYIIEIFENYVKVPWEVLTAEGMFELSVIGYEDEKVITSNKVEIQVSESLLPEEYKTFSPSEVLFDRFKRECTAQAYLDYEDEINLLKKLHTKEILLLNGKIAEANEQISIVEEEKNAEIQELNNQIVALKSEMEEYMEKAEKWDLVDSAIGLKTAPTQALWTGGSDVYSLPMLNTSSITAFSSTNFSANLKEIGLDLTEVSTMASVFSSHKSIEVLMFRNAKNVMSFAGMLEACKTIVSVEIDNLRKCNTLSRFANEASMLQKVTFGSNLGAANYERCFCNCVLLKEINGLIDMSFATEVNYMFHNCMSLETVSFVESSIGVSIDFSTCVRLSKNSLENIFNALYPGADYTLSVSKYNFENNFTEDEQEEWISFVTQTKGWILSIN